MIKVIDLGPPTEFEREYRTEVEIIPKLIRDLGLVPQ